MTFTKIVKWCTQRFGMASRPTSVENACRWIVARGSEEWAVHPRPLPKCVTPPLFLVNVTYDTVLT